VVERITEEAEADRQLLRFLWESGIRPGSRIVVAEVAPYAGTVSILLEGRTITMGLSAASKIWVYDPMEPSERPKPGRSRRAAKPTA
jgi:Fe2+ transport system protein FeoA